MELYTRKPHRDIKLSDCHYTYTATGVGISFLISVDQTTPIYIMKITMLPSPCVTNFTK